SPCFSNFRYQLRLLDVAEGDFHHADAGFPAFAVLLDRGQIDRDLLARLWIRSGDQAPLPMPVVANRLEGLHLHKTPHEPVKILWPAQLAIQPRRARLQRIGGPWNEVFHVE